MGNSFKGKSVWALTELAFAGLMLQFSTDDVAAAEQYLTLQKNLIRFFEVRNLSNAEDLADEVFNRIAKKIEQGEVIEKMSSYALTIARFVALEDFKKPQFDELPEKFEEKYVQSQTSDDEQHEADLQKLENHLSQLSPADKRVILQYYAGETAEKIKIRRQLAEELGLQQNALTKKITRLRDKLEGMMREDNR